MIDMTELLLGWYPVIHSELSAIADFLRIAVSLQSAPNRPVDVTTSEMDIGLPKILGYLDSGIFTWSTIGQIRDTDLGEGEDTVTLLRSAIIHVGDRAVRRATSSTR